MVSKFYLTLLFWLALSVRSYRSLPRLPDPTFLEDWRISIVRPVGRTNLILNPSLETNTTGYTADGGSIARSTTYAYHGAYSLAVTPSATVTSGAYYTTSTLVASTVYAISVKFIAPTSAGRPFRLTIASNAGVALQTYAFTATGQWQWLTILWTAASAATHRIYVSKNGGTQTALYYIDGLQLEACAANEYFPTTYIDGDQLGLLGAVELPPYYWTGTPHASTSVRSGQTRAGGRVISLDRYGFQVTNASGLGLAPVQPITTPFGQLDGVQFLDIRKTERGVTLTGRWGANTPRQKERQIAVLAADLDRDLIATRQPLTILAEPLDCGDVIRAPFTIPGLSYTGGLEGSIDGLPVEESILSFTQYQPQINGGENGAALTVISTPSGGGVDQRAPDGTWSRLASSGGVFFSPIAYALALGLDGTIYAGSSSPNLSDATAVGYIARWNGSAWAAMGTGMNALVRCLAVAPNGNIYAGGDFTTAGGGAANYIAMWNGSAWSALGTGMNNTVLSIAVAPNGDVYAGGVFTTAGGGAANYVARWNGSAWSALSSGMNSGVEKLIFGPDGLLYAGGAFTTAGGGSANNVARWNGSAWSALSSGMNSSVFALAFGLNGILYAAGNFTTAGGISVGYIAQWNGVQWSALGSGFNTGQVLALAVDPRTGILHAGGQFTTAGGLSSPYYARWNGSSWVRSDLALSGTNYVYSLLPRQDGTLFTGMGSSTIVSAAGITTVTNRSTVLAYPTLRIVGPTSGTASIVQLVNTTSGAAIYFNTIIAAGETITLVLAPGRISYTSSFRGNILGEILPGSDTTAWALQPGTNTVSFYSLDSTVTAVLFWSNDLASLLNGWTQ